MQLTRTLAIALIATVAGFSSVDAKNLRQGGSPAELPPSSFKGRQFVDSRGCVFIRAGVDGSTNWVARVARDRRMICGFKPTFSGKEAATTRPVVTEKVVKIVPLDATPAAPAPKAEPVRTARVAAAPAPVVVPAQPKRTVRKVVRKPAKLAAPKTMDKPVQVKSVRKVKTVKRVAPAKVAAAPNCSGISAVSQQYLSHATANVRCGAQSQNANTAAVRSAQTTTTTSYTSTQPKVIQRRIGAQPRRAVNTSTVAAAPVVARPHYGQVVTEGQVGSNVRILPKHVYQRRAALGTVGKPPKGYRSVWEDDRLNNRRAEGTFAGKAQMERIWSKGTPRKGKLAEVSAAASHTKASGVRTIVGSKGSTPAKTMQLGDNRFVQVAAYGSSKDAQNVARRVKSLGLPVRVGKINRNGKIYRLVLAGPFSNASSAEAAARKARRAGYQNATIR